MCGLAGFCFFDKTYLPLEPEKILKDITNAISHRGPDDSGQWISEDSKVFLGHRRLSILDLTNRANQPMISSSKKWIISFNGEVYNYKELKENILLSAEDSSGDTVVLLSLIEKFGLKKAVNMIEGMFALVAYNKVNNKIYLVRDRLGEKPLYYSYNKKFCIFGSEIKVFKNFPKFNFDISKDSVLNYFDFNYVPRQKTIYKHINKVNPGEIIEINLDNTEIIKENYWKTGTVLNQNQNVNLNFEEVVDKVENLLTEIIKKETRSDVEIGCFLSSGVDSSLIASIASKNIKNLKTFTLFSNFEIYLVLENNPICFSIFRLFI